MLPGRGEISIAEHEQQWEFETKRKTILMGRSRSEMEAETSGRHHYEHSSTKNLRGKGIFMALDGIAE